MDFYSSDNMDTVILDNILTIYKSQIFYFFLVTNRNIPDIAHSTQNNGVSRRCDLLYPTYKSCNKAFNPAANAYTISITPTIGFMKVYFFTDSLQLT